MYGLGTPGTAGTSGTPGTAGTAGTSATQAYPTQLIACCLFESAGM